MRFMIIMLGSVTRMDPVGRTHYVNSVRILASNNCNFLYPHICIHSCQNCSCGMAKVIKSQQFAAANMT